VAPLEVGALEALVGSDPQIIDEFLQAFGVSAARSAVALREACAEQRRRPSLRSPTTSNPRLARSAPRGSALSAPRWSWRGPQGLCAVGRVAAAFEREMAVVADYLRSLRVNEGVADRCA